MKRLIVAVLVLFLIGCNNEEETLKIKRDIANVQEQIYQLESQQVTLRQELLDQMKVLERKFDDRTSQADTKDKISKLEQELSEYQALVLDLESKVSELKRNRTQVSLAVPNPPGGETPEDGLNEAGEPDTTAVPQVSGDVVEAQYKQAFMDYNRGKFAVAIQGFRDILANFPGSPYSERAMYYLGNSLFQTKEYQDSRETFSRIIKEFPNGDYVKQAMYYEGRCYYNLNQPAKAILALRELIEKHQGTQEAELANSFLKQTGYER